MRRFSVALAAAGASLFLAACMSDRDSTSPSSLTPRATASATVTPATCDYNNTMKGYARDYFNGSTKNAVLSLIGQMANATTAANRQAVAFSIMSKVASARLTSAANSATLGATFVDYVLGCADLDASLLTTHTALVLSSGIFEVRGGSSDDKYQALAFVKTSAGTKALATPRWGVQPKDAVTKSWAATPGSFIVFGYPISVNGVNGVGAPAALNTNEVGSPSYNGFELGTVPAHKESSNLLVGLCVSAFTSTSSAVNLLFHTEEIQKNTSPSFCTTSDVPGFALLPSKTWLASVGDRLTSIFAPKKLTAQDFESRLGGLPSGWSPFHSGLLTGTNTALSFSTPPHDWFINAIMGDVVVAVTVPSTDPAIPGFVPAPAGISVTLSISGNSGSPSFFIVDGATPAKSFTVTTDGTGHATFKNFAVTKAGGFLATATGSLGGLATTQSKTSDMFWIKNKTAP